MAGIIRIYEILQLIGLDKSETNKHKNKRLIIVQEKIYICTIQKMAEYTFCDDTMITPIKLWFWDEAHSPVERDKEEILSTEFC